jgi:hypothetical protein
LIQISVQAKNFDSHQGGIKQVIANTCCVNVASSPRYELVVAKQGLPSRLGLPLKRGLRKS